MKIIHNYISVSACSAVTFISQSFECLIFKFYSIVTSSCCVCSLNVTREERQFGEICVSDEDEPATAELELPAVVAEVDALLVMVEDVRLVVEARGDIPLATPKLL